MRLGRWLIDRIARIGGRGASRPALPRDIAPGTTDITVTPGETVRLPDGTVLRCPTDDALDQRRLTKLHAWQAQLAAMGGVAPKPVTRGDLTAVLRARGWDRVIKDGETLFLRHDDRGAARIFPTLKTRTGTAHHAPDQRLTLRCVLSPNDYLAVVTAIYPPDPPPLVRQISVERQGFILTRTDLDSAVSEAEAKLAAADIAMHLDQAAGWDPARPGSAGLVHLAALVLRGDRARLDRYAALGADAGFVPFITPDTLARAAAMARDRRD